MAHAQVLDKLAFLISALASPFITITIFSFWIIAAYSSSWAEFALWGSSAFLLVILVPFFYVWYGVRKGYFSDLHIMIREQRAEPYRVATLSAIVLAIVYALENAPRQLVALALALMICGLVFYWITQVWKISMHAAAFTGSIVLTALLITPQVLWLLLFLPLLIWARLRRRRHDMAQALGAAALVAGIIYGMFFFVLYI